MGATASAAAGATHTGSPQTTATDRPQATAAAAPAPVIVGSLTTAGRTKNVAEARAFVARTLGPAHSCTDVAVLLCSELVTNAVLHSESGQPGGTVTVVVARPARRGPGGGRGQRLRATAPRWSRPRSTNPTVTACSWSSSSPTTGATPAMRWAPRCWFRLIC